MKKRTKLRVVLAISIVVAAVAGVAVSLAKLRGPEAEIPTVRVVRGDVALQVFATGDLRSPRTATLVAPSVGGTLQIVELAKTGATVHAGDVVVQFDPSEQEYSLEQARSQLAAAEEKIIKMKADTAVQVATDQVSLLHAQYDVKRAQLDVSLNELKSAIEGKENDLALEGAQRKLAQIQQDIQSRAASNEAQLAVLDEQRNKAQLDIKVAQQHIDSMTLRSPIAGLVTVKENRDASGGFFFEGMTLPEFRQGDLTQAGRPIVQVMDTTQMEVLARVPENVRADISAGQTAEIRVDALPERTYSAKVKTVAGQATQDIFSDDPMRRFDVIFSLDASDPGLKPGLSSQIQVVGEQLRKVLYLPRQALFLRDGKAIVYAKVGRSFEPRVVQVKHMTESEVVLEGLPEGAEVALVNPEKSNGSASAGPVVAPRGTT
jgi:multidrug resistance efflux pump